MSYRTDQPIAAAPRSSNHWEDWATVVLAVWFFISPWVLQFGSGAATTPPAAGAAATQTVSTAAWNAWVLAVIVFLVALSAIGRMEFWQEWINAILGAWIFASPWALGFIAGPFVAARWDHWIVGALIFILALLNIAESRRLRVGVRRTEHVPGPQ